MTSEAIFKWGFLFIFLNYFLPLTLLLVFLMFSVKEKERKKQGKWLWENRNNLRVFWGQMGRSFALGSQKLRTAWGLTELLIPQSIWVNYFPLVIVSCSMVLPI